MKTKIHKFKKIQDKLMAKKLGFILAMVPVLALGQSQDQNYIKQTTYKQANQNQVENPDIDVATIQVNYYNGLGYPIQQISHKQSGTGKDIITYIAYDEFGRQTKEFLPYVSQSASLDFDLSSDINQANYYSSNPDPSFETTDYPFSEKTLDDSPLNRLLKQAAPGEVWKKNNGHEIQFVYDVNATSDEVFQFEVISSSNGNGYTYSLNCIGYYDPGALYKNITKNENWSSGLNNTTEEYTDDLGRVVLKRTYNNGQKYDTNYVYDKVGNLIYVIPPLASDTVANVTVTQEPLTYFSQSFYISEFLVDTQGNPVTSGAGSMYLIIENNTIRLVFSAGFNSATFDLSKQLEINAPEPIPDMTLGYVDFYYNGNHQFIVQIQNNKLFFEDYTPNDPTLYFTQLPGISQNLTQPISINLGYETIYTPSTNSNVLEPLCYQYKYDYRNRLVEKKLPGKQWEFIVYDKLDRPVATGPAFIPYGGTEVGWLITEYDVFGRVVKTGWKQMTVDTDSRASYQNSINSGSNPFPISQNEKLIENYYDNYSFLGTAIPTTLPDSTFPIAQNVKGLQTGSWVRVLDSNNPNAFELSYTLFDNKYRPVRTHTDNYLGGYTEIDTNLDWAGKTLYTLTKHKFDASADEIVVKDMFEYTDQDRLSIHKQQINSDPEQLIVSNTYDELGQLISKNVGGIDTTGAIGLQKVDYTYNIRGWLKQINDVNTIGNDLFAFKINYNDPVNATTALYNGNISETHWKTANDNILRTYEYSYDKLNRLTNAIYKNEASILNSYGESLTYDKNGNIQTLNRAGGLEDPMYVYEIDILKYTYHPQNKNQLIMVADTSGFPEGFKDDVDSNAVLDTTEDYDYDDNGNMERDDNKGISHISYNHLNLPVEIIFNNNQNTKIGYIYNAIGQKLVKNVFSQYNGGSGGEEFKSSSRTMTTLVNNVETTVYLSGFQYKNNILQFFPTAEGYVKLDKNGQYSYVYNYTDHLGNVRLSYSDFDKNGILGNEEVVIGGDVPLSNPYIDYISPIIEENNYYPFGLKHSGYYNENEQQSYQYKFNGKELQDELGLNMYDFHARNYMPDLGRTTSYDPLAEKFYDFSPQSFFNNNPVYFVDPTGMSTEQNEWKPKVNEDGSTSYIAEKGDTSATFAKQYNISESDAMSIVGNRTYEGMEVTGQQVFDVLGTESLKLDLNSGLDTPQRKIDHFIYAMHHSKSKGVNYFRATDYFQNILQGELQTPQDIKGNITLDNGQTATIQMKLPFYTSTGSFFSGGTDYHYAFYSNKTITSPSQGNGTMFGGLQPINHYIIGYGFIFNGKPVLQGGSQHGIWMSILRKHDSSFERTILDRQVPEFRYHNFKPKSKM